MSSIPEFFRSSPDAPSHSSSENVEVISRNALASGFELWSSAQLPMLGVPASGVRKYLREMKRAEQNRCDDR